MKVMLVLSYDGSKFYGFQRQKNVRNVQGYLENTLSNILKEDILVKGAGRTDAGVHSLYQVVHFETSKDINNLKNKLNNVLEDIKIKKVKVVNDDFHARHSALSKTYLYKIDLSGKKDSNYYNIIKYKLDIKKMKEAAKLFLGTHDFHNFVSGFRDDYNSTIYKISIYKFNNTLYLKFTGRAFYRYMVRNLVGALIEIGKGKIDKSVIKDMLENPEVEKSLPTASPNGLYLLKIKY